MGKNNEGLSQYLYLLPFLPVVVYAIITIWYNLYHLINNGGTKAMVLQIGASFLAAIIAGIFSVYAVKSQRRYRRLEEAMGNILEKGTLTEQHSRIGQSLTEQHSRMERSLTGQHSQMEQSLRQITGNTGEHGNLTAQHNRISKEVEALVDRAEAMDHRNATLSQDAKKISESITVLGAFQGLLGKQSEELAERNLEIQELKNEVRTLRAELSQEKERTIQRKGKSR